ncbi:MAG: hypothetical protein COT18_00205 [Elusimicrobia bacterium CG08_land_8_20_14_0_20_59_10]|nr:MAG: hypothetical protein COT18_00205 [Elusimicrobia bacterium CG08_land_8_20_14_0_20_59_10]
MHKTGIPVEKIFFTLFISLWAAGMLAPGCSRAATPEHELQRLTIRQAAVKVRAWEDPRWFELMYYEKNLFGRLRSSVVNPGFFLAKWGSISPRLELEAAIDGLFYEGEPDDGPECLFPERYRWLRKKFGIPAFAFPRPPCAKFEDWKAGLSTQTASLVFASGDLRRPAAFHGDLFLRLKGRGQDGEEKDGIIACRPSFRDENLFFTAARALTGGQQCGFSVFAASGTRKAYPGIAIRGQWEFPLGLSREEQERLLRRLWELEKASFTWKPFTRNCAWRMLRLLDTARQTSAASARFHAWVTPLDAARAAVTEAAEKNAVWRPPLWKTVSWKREQLYMGETASVHELVRGDQPAALKKLENMNAWHGANVLETASDYLDWVYYSGRISAAAYARSAAPLEKARAFLGKAAFTGGPQRPASPLGIHESLRAGAGIASLKNGAAYELQGRLAGSDLLDQPAGYLPDSALENGAFRLRYEKRYNRLYFKQAALLHIVSLTPWDDWTRSGSWELSAGVEQAGETGRQSGRAAVWDMNFGYGPAAELDGAMRQVWYAMAVANSSFGPALNSGWRAGAGLKAGVLAENGPLRLLCEARYLAYPMGDGRPLWAGSAGTSYSLGSGLSARLEYSWRGKAKETGLYLHRFFSAP